MVRAILEGRKTQTRRVITPQPIHDGTFWTWKPDSIDRGWTDKPEDRYNDPTLGNIALRSLCPYGRPGDRLWVKERFALHKDSDRLSPKNAPKDCRFYFDEHGRQTGTNPRIGRWRSSRFMPRWHSRIDLEITDVRAERVQDISAEDAIAEGVESVGRAGGKDIAWRLYANGATGCTNRPEDSYSTLWDSINKERGYGWDANPWAWVIEFKKL